jgi:hypothetical protein
MTVNTPVSPKPLSGKSKEWSPLFLQIQVDVHIEGHEKQAKMC